LESVCWGNSTVGSNPTLSAIKSCSFSLGVALLGQHFEGYLAAERGVVCAVHLAESMLYCANSRGSEVPFAATIYFQGDRSSPWLFVYSACDGRFELVSARYLG
jgi:hypothetical protein